MDNGDSGNPPWVERKLLVHWKDGSETWVPLKDMKESHPIEVAEFAKARGVADEPAIAY